MPADGAYLAARRLRVTSSDGGAQWTVLLLDDDRQACGQIWEMAGLFSDATWEVLPPRSSNALR